MAPPQWTQTGGADPTRSTCPPSVAAVPFAIAMSSCRSCVSVASFRHESWNRASSFIVIVRRRRPDCHWSSNQEFHDGTARPTLQAGAEAVRSRPCPSDRFPQLSQVSRERFQ